MNRPVRFSQPASEELAEVVRWYDARRAGLGGEFFDAVAAALTVIGTHLEIGPTVSTDGLTRRLLVAGFPYQIVYRLRPTEIAVVAIAHLKQQPNYWKTRN